MKKKVIMWALGLSLAGGQAAGQNIQTEALRVWMDNVALTADGQTSTRLTVYQNDAERDYTAFNMSLVVPEGITVAQVKKGRNMVNSIELSVRATETHNISCQMPESTLIKIMCSSTQNDDLYPDDEDGNLVDELFTIDLVADPQMVNGTYTVTTEGVVFAYNKDNVVTGYVPATQPTFQMTITDGQDGLTIPYALTAAGVGTLVLPFDAEVPEGLAVFTATDVIGAEVQLAQQTRILAGMPLIVTGEAGSYTFTGVPSTTGTTFTEGVLTGTTVAQTITAGYVLQTQNGQTGFYRVSTDDPISVPGYRCWLNYESEVKWLGLPDALTTALQQIINGKGQDGQWYDLNGRRTTSRRAGVYIQQGKKHLLKTTK